jgi:protein ImuB
VVVEKVDNALRLSALDRKATSLGLAIGQPLANARAMLPSLRVMSANAPADQKLLEHIADWCDRFTPFVALDGVHGLLLDVTGASHLSGGEQAMLDNIRERLHAQGFAVRGALAGTAMAARALARYKDGTVVAPGKETDAIAPLPIEALTLGPVITHAFRRAGLKTVGQVANRDRTELTARFGAGMVFTLDSALGRAEKPISPRLPLPNYRVEHHFAEPIVMEEAIRSALQSLASTLSDVLERNGEGARRLEAAFFRTDGTVRRIAIETGSPTRDPAIIDRLFRERLDSLSDPLDPGFGYDLIRLSASHTDRADCAAADFDAACGADREILFLIDRLAARFGSHRIFSFQPNDTHIPEAEWVAVPAQHAGSCKLPWKPLRKKKETPRRPLRMLASPEAVDVLSSVHNTQMRFRWRNAVHSVKRIEGPERIAMEWWRHQTPQPTRDYFRVEDEEGRRFWLYRNGVPERDGVAPRWFMHGAFA